MRKKTVSFMADTIFWYILYFLPIISYLLFCFSEPIAVGSSGAIIPFSTYINTAYNFIQDNFIFTALNDIFGANGVMPLGLDSALLLYFSWFIGTVIIHLAVDFLLFIPRLCHKWLKTFCQGE